MLPDESSDGSFLSHQMSRLILIWRVISLDESFYQMSHPISHLIRYSSGETSHLTNHLTCYLVSQNNFNFLNNNSAGTNFIKIYTNGCPSLFNVS